MASPINNGVLINWNCARFPVQPETARVTWQGTAVHRRLPMVLANLQIACASQRVKRFRRGISSIKRLRRCLLPTAASHRCYLVL